MTFLELVQALKRECSVSGEGPSTVVNQTGEMRRLVEWIKQAHEEIQEMYFDWFFLWNQTTLTTVSGESTITDSNVTFPADLNVWDKNRFYIDNSKLNVYEYEDYQPQTETSGKPTSVYVLPNNTLKLIPTPDDAYDIVVDYYKVPKVLSSNTDEPLIPARFQRAIIGMAITFYGYYESAPELIERGQKMIYEAMRQLTNHQLKGRQDKVSISSPDIVVRPE